MNAWNQWGAAAAAAYPTPLPGYAAAQTAAAPTMPGAAAGLPPVAAAAAVPYPAMPGFQAWPYAAAPQAMAPWAAATAGAAAPAGQAAQWDQWNQWHQQYSQWQQQYAAQSGATTALTHQINTASVATPKVGILPQVQAVASSITPTLATNTTTTAATISGNIKRPNEVPADSLQEAKKPRTDQPSLSQAAPLSTTSKELEELSEAEKQFDEQFKSWEAQFDTWRQQNANHPDTDQYKAYEAKWASWREQLLARREQMKKKREKLTEAASTSASIASVKPVSEPIEVVSSVSSVATAIPNIYSGYNTAPGVTSTPSVSQYQSHYQQPQPQFIPAYLGGPASVNAPLSSVVPSSAGSSHSQPIPVISSGGQDDSSSQHREFLKTSTSSGIPGLDLLSGGTTQGDVKTLTSVSFANSTQMPFQTPADNKPFDFPPPRQGQGFPGHIQQAVQQATSVSNPQQSAATAALAHAYAPGILPTPSMQPPGFPPSFNNQAQPGVGFQGAAQAGAYHGGFPGQTPGSGYQATQAPPGGGFPPQNPTGYQVPPTTGFQQTHTPPTSTFQAQAPSAAGYQQPSAYGQPPPTGFPPMTGYMPPGPYPLGGGFPQQEQAHQGFQSQQGPPGNFQDLSKSGAYPFQQQPQNRQQYPPTSSAQDQSKKLPGLMDNVMPGSSEQQPASEVRGDNFPRNPSRPDTTPNKYPDRFGDKQMGSRFGDPQFAGKDNGSGFSLPKPKGYFNMQEMSEEEEYEKFHEYQQAIEKEHEDEDGPRRPRPGDDSRTSRYDRPTRFEDASPRYQESGPRPKFDEPRPRFEEGKPSRFDGNTRPTRFDGPPRTSRFEEIPPNRFPLLADPPDKDKFKRSFEKETQGPPPPMGVLPQQSPSKSARPTPWGAPEPEKEQGPPRNVERRLEGGGLGPPYGATPDGSDFLFATIIDYNHTSANLGVPDYFEPMSVIDYTHGLNGIKVEESKDDWERKKRGSGRGSSPHSWDRDSRGSFNESRNSWKEDRGRPYESSSGPRGGSEGSRGGSDGSRGGSNGPSDTLRGGPDGFRGGPDGPRRSHDGPRGGHDGPRGGSDGSRGSHDGPRGSHDGPRGGHDGPRGGPDGSRGSHDGPRSGSDGPRGGPDGMRGGPDGMRGGPDGIRGGPDGSRGGPDRSRGGHDGPRGGSDSFRGGSDGQRDPDGPRGGSGGPSSRWGEPDDRDRRRRDEPLLDSRSRSPDRGRRSDRSSGRDDRRKDSDMDRPKRSGSPMIESRGEPPLVGAVPPVVKKEVVSVDDVLQPPGREGRPAKIAIFLRGPPGSGKSFLAKMIKEKEVKNGGTAPRILSLDDYFMSDIEKEEVDTDSGRTVKTKVMEYEFEAAMEVKYRESLNKCFRKTVTDGYFPFIIVDANNDKISFFDSMISFCQVRGFCCYIVDMEQDLSMCLRRNIHKRNEKDIENIIKSFEETPAIYRSLDVRSLLQEASIPEVDMEDSMDTAQSDDTQDKPEIIEIDKEEPPAEDKKPENASLPDNNAEDTDKDNNKQAMEEKSAERTGFARFTISSKWDDLDTTCSKLDRLDGFTAARKPRPTIQDWLQIPDSEASTLPQHSSVGSKKRVRWADVEERSKQAMMKALGFVVGQTDWSRMMDPHSAISKLTQTKYI